MASTSFGQSSGSSSGQSTSSGSSFIPNYPQSPFLLALAGHIAAYADQSYADYDKTFKPIEQSLITRSNQELSPTYQLAMGARAAAGAQQSFEQARNNAIRELGGFGVGDPSNVGRSYALNSQLRGQGAAAAAGASNEAIDLSRKQGIADQGAALQLGQNSLNRAAQLQNTAMNLKYPPLGNNTNSQSTQESKNQGTNSSNSSNPPPPPASQPRSGAGGGDPSTSGNNGSFFDPNLYKQSDYGGAVSTGGGNGSGGAGIGTIDPANYDNNAGDQWQPYNTGFTDASAGYNDPYYSDPLANYAYNPNTTGYDPASNPWGDAQGTTDNSGYTGWDNGGGDSGGGDYWAEGGAIPLQKGGVAPTNASPSGGAQTDDIDAKVNANEFVIPQDVALWKGQEFFYKLMDQSRKTRVEYQSGTKDQQQSPPEGMAEGGPVQAIRAWR
jgi:hypothetical protein